MPRWMAAQIKAGKKREDFAIDKAAAKSKKGRTKKARGKRTTGSVSRKTTPNPCPARQLLKRPRKKAWLLLQV